MSDRLLDSLGSHSFRTTMSPQSTILLSMTPGEQSSILTKLTSLPAKIWFLKFAGMAAEGEMKEVPLDGAGVAVANV